MPHYYSKRFFQTNSAEAKTLVDRSTPGSAAFADCEASAVADLYYQFARKTGVEGECYLDPEGVRELLTSIGERPDDDMLQDIFQTADVSRKGTINLKVCVRYETCAVSNVRCIAHISYISPFVGISKSVRQNSLWSTSTRGSCRWRSWFR